MNKAELIRTVAEKSGLSRKDAASAVRAMLEAIPEELKRILEMFQNVSKQIAAL